MVKTSDVHLQFASYFPDENIWPFVYILSQKISEGNICMDVSDIEPSNLPEFLRKIELDKLENSSLVGSDAVVERPFILHQQKLYLQRYFKYETIIIEKIKEIIASEYDFYSERIAYIQANKNQLLSLFSSKSGIVDWQFVACVSAYLHQFFILTGGPGTGKTTTIAKMLQWMIGENANLRIGLTAPTGKAAVRMAESLGNAATKMSESLQLKIKELEPQTIHRLLGSKKQSLYFKYNSENYLPYDVLIIDECSMVDTALFAKFLSAVGPKTKVILLGDKNQLASVEAGSIFGDLCKIRPYNNIYSKKISGFFKENLETKLKTNNFDTSILVDHITELEVSHRFNAQMGIGKLSKAVIENEQTTLSDFFDQPELEFEIRMDANYSDSIFESFVNGYRDYIIEKDIVIALQKLDELRVLCAVREGKFGTINKNIQIEEFLIKNGLLNKNYENEYYENRPIIVTKNNYDLKLYNGDIGIIRDGKAWFSDNSLPEKVRSVNAALISSIETVFAMTIHKSQGSEFGKVLLVLPTIDAHKLLTLELIYTGITRAKYNVTIQSDKTIFLESCTLKVNRVSGLQERL